jgi:ABC-type protease/lipase transport system fused ATPase/permease subunit
MAISKPSNVLRDAFHGVRHIAFFAVLLSLVYGLLKLSGPLFMILIFNQVLPSRSEATLVTLLLLMVVVIGVMTLLDYSRRRILARFGAQFQERIEDHIFSSTARDTYFARGGSKPADGLKEVDQLRGFFHSSSLVIILDFLWSPVFLAVLFIIDPLIGWVVVAGLALLVLINTVKASFGKAREERHGETSERIGALKDTLRESRHVIESQQLMAAYNKRWVLARRRSRDTAVELKDWHAWFSILSSHTALLIQYTALAAGAYLTIEGKMTIGTMVASMYLARHVFNPAERFLKQVPNIREAIENLRSLDKVLSAARTPTATPGGATALRLSRLAVRCPLTRNPLLRNVSIEVSPGSSVEIVGGGCSGKTVLAETLIGRFPRAGGKILLGAIDVERLSIIDAAKTVGYVPQRVDFISGTIEENIAGLDAEPDRDRLVHAARLAQVHDRILSLPEGYLTRIDAVGGIFSKGERHRLALARALYPDPKLLIVDEPDTTFRDALSKGLENEIADFLARGGILIMLTRLALKRYHPTRRFTLDDGLLKEVKFDQTSGLKVVRVQNG